MKAKLQKRGENMSDQSIVEEETLLRQQEIDDEIRQAREEAIMRRYADRRQSNAIWAQLEGWEARLAAARLNRQPQTRIDRLSCCAEMVRAQWYEQRQREEAEVVRKIRLGMIAPIVDIASVRKYLAKNAPHLVPELCASVGKETRLSQICRIGTPFLPLRVWEDECLDCGLTCPLKKLLNRRAQAGSDKVEHWQKSTRLVR